MQYDTQRDPLAPLYEALFEATAALTTISINLGNEDLADPQLPRALRAAYEWQVAPALRRLEDLLRQG